MTPELIDPCRVKTLQFYQDPTSETFGNLKQSALRAGFAPSYANQLSSMRPDWLTENLQSTVELITRAEKNLKRYANMEIDLKDNPSKSKIELAKLQTDVSKFLLKTLARRKYSEDKEAILPSITIQITNYGSKDQKMKVIDAELQSAESIAPIIESKAQGAEPESEAPSA